MNVINEVRDILAEGPEGYHKMRDLVKGRELGDIEKHYIMKSFEHVLHPRIIQLEFDTDRPQYSFKSYMHLRVQNDILHALDDASVTYHKLDVTPKTLCLAIKLDLGWRLSLVMLKHREDNVYVRLTLYDDGNLDVYQSDFVNKGPWKCTYTFLDEPDPVLLENIEAIETALSSVKYTD